MINLKGAGGGGVDFQPAETYTISTNVSDLTVTGLSGFRDLKFWGSIGHSNTAICYVQCRTSGGAWTTILSVPPTGGTGGAQAYAGHIRNFNGGSLIYPNKTKIFKGDGLGINGGTASVSAVNYVLTSSADTLFFRDEVWDEFRLFTASTFDGSDADALYISGSYGDT